MSPLPPHAQESHLVDHVPHSPQHHLVGPKSCTHHDIGKVSQHVFWISIYIKANILGVTPTATEELLAVDSSWVRENHSFGDVWYCCLCFSGWPDTHVQEVTAIGDIWRSHVSQTEW